MMPIHNELNREFEDRNLLEKIAGDLLMSVLVAQGTISVQLWIYIIEK